MGFDRPIQAAVLTVSDKGWRGERIDTSGPAATEALVALGASVVAAKIVPDEIDEIRSTLAEWSDRLGVDVVITTGGTGLSPRDRTPEATAGVVERLAPGIAEALRLDGLAKTPMAALSRGVAGVRGATLIVNLPGSEKAVREGMAVLARVLPHAVAILREGGEHPEGGAG